MSCEQPVNHGSPEWTLGKHRMISAVIPFRLLLPVGPMVFEDEEDFNWLRHILCDLAINIVNYTFDFGYIPTSSTIDQNMTSNQWIFNLYFFGKIRGWWAPSTIFFDVTLTRWSFFPLHDPHSIGCCVFFVGHISQFQVALFQFCGTFFDLGDVFMLVCAYIFLDLFFQLHYFFFAFT